MERRHEKQEKKLTKLLPRGLKMFMNAYEEYEYET